MADDDVVESGGIPCLSLEGPHPSGEKVHLDGQDQLIWPVLLLYPEYGQTDFIAAFNENQRYLSIKLVIKLIVKQLLD